MNPERNPEEYRKARKVFAAYFLVLSVLLTGLGIWKLILRPLFGGEGAGETFDLSTIIVSLLGFPMVWAPVLLGGAVSYLLWRYVRRP